MFQDERNTRCTDTCPLLFPFRHLILRRLDHQVHPEIWILNPPWSSCDKAPNVNLSDVGPFSGRNKQKKSSPS